jgi:hypothetical protein
MHQIDTVLYCTAMERTVTVAISEPQPQGESCDIVSDLHTHLTI